MRYHEIIREAAKSKMRPTARDLADIRRERHEARCDDGNGGQCGWVTEYCQGRWGWEQHSGTYCNDADEPICVGCDASHGGTGRD